MKEETGRVKEKNGSEFRIRDNLTNTLTRKFVETMKDYQNAQSKYKAFVQKKVVRQVHIVKPEATAGGLRDGMGGGLMVVVHLSTWAHSTPTKTKYAHRGDRRRDAERRGRPIPDAGHPQGALRIQ